MSTIVKACTCSHSSQDTIYGKSQRLMNTDVKNKEAKCTVCNAVHRGEDLTKNPTFRK